MSYKQENNPFRKSPIKQNGDEVKRAVKKYSSDVTKKKFPKPIHTY